MSKSEKDLNLKRLYEGSTKNVFKSVIIGKAVAGVTLDVDLRNEDPDVVDQLKVIMKTSDIPSHPLSAHPRVPPNVREALIRAILKLGKQTEEAAMLRNVRLMDPMRADYARDYRGLEEMDIEKLVAEPMN